MTGDKVTLWANYVTLEPKVAEMTIHFYDVETTPATSGKKRAQIIRILFRSDVFKAYCTRAASDLAKLLVSIDSIPNTKFALKYYSEVETEADANAQEYVVSVKHAKSCHLSDLLRFIQFTEASVELTDPAPLLQALNIFQKHNAKMSHNVVTKGRGASRIFELQKPLQFDRNPNSAVWDLGGFLYAMRGYYSSVRAATGRVLVNVTVTHGAFFKERPLLEILRSCSSLRHMNAIVSRLVVDRVHINVVKNGQRVPAPVTLIGIASPKYGRNRANPPRIPRICANANEVEFWLEQNGAAQGRYISVADFFKQNGDPLTCVDYVVVYGSMDRPMFLPAAVCRTIPGTPYRLQLGPNEMARMGNFSVRKPQANASSIVNQGLQMVGLSGDATKLHSINMPAIPQLITVHARVLQPPVLKYHRPQRVQHGSWDLRDCKFHTPMKVSSWGALIIHEQGLASFRDAKAALEATRKLQEAMEVCSMSAAPIQAKSSLHRVSLDKNFESTATQYLQKIRDSGAHLVVVVVPRRDHPIYLMVKRIVDQDIGIHTVCVAFETLTKHNWMQTLCNVALKVNLKLGGINHLTVFENSFINDGKTMLVGYDVAHPGFDSAETAPSIVGMVASVDKHLNQWPASLEAQERRKEETTCLDAMLRRNLGLWKTKGRNPDLPENIVIYRDGVAEYQYDMVLSKELPQMRKAFAALYPAKKQPRVTIIVVGKRHHTRFYPTSADKADRTGNPKAGTVVDRGITLHRSWDFYLQAHAAIKGTARPAHYYVLLDQVFCRHTRGNTRNVADDIQVFTMALSHTFGRATKAISVCTPARLADIACDRGRAYLASVFEAGSDGASTSTVEPLLGPIQIAPQLRDSMFYL